MKRTFIYRAKDINGNVHEGTIEADKMTTAVSQLRQQQLYITKLKTVTRGMSPAGKVSTGELAAFCRQLATLLQAGVPIISALNVLESQLISKPLQRGISTVRDSISNGQPMATAMKHLPDIFPNIVVSMVQAGEHSGRLDNVLYNLADYLDREQEIKGKVKSAIVYPLFIVVLAAMMVMFVLTFVLPNYVHMLNQFNLELPLITRVLIKTSSFMVGYWYLLFLLIAAALLCGFKVYNNGQLLKEIKDRYLLQLPIVGRIYHKMLIARFCHTLALLLRSGVPLIQALTLVRNVVDNVMFAQAVDSALMALQRGDTLAGSLGKSNLFHQTVVQMIAIGEQSGQLDQQLALIATVEERDVSAAISKISPLMEPILLLITSVIVGIILIAIMLPIFKSLGAAASF
ncbi:type II secretion system F family protein [Peptococcaceae bacterium 1198_IL3148]